MKYTYLGRTGISVSQLCFGTMSFGGDADAAMAGKMYAACRDAGINFFDCANVYSAGRAEEILGDLIAHERDDIVLTSKVGHGPSPGERGLSPRHIQLAVDASLKRLGTDRLDVLFVHRWDDHTPMEETLRALENVVRQGKAMSLAVSNWSAWQIAKAIGISAQNKWARFDVIQPMYSLVKRQAEVEILPLALAEGLAVTPYSPVGGGLLSGKYRSKESQGRIRANKEYTQRYSPDWMFDTASGFADFAEKHGWHPVSLAVAWVAANPAITAPIIGARDTGQLAPSLEALDIPMTEELRQEIAALSPTPPPATDRLEEQG